MRRTAIACGTIMLGWCCLAAPAQAAGPRVGQKAPVFAAHNLYGKPVTLNQFRGKVILLNFWATWCGPCRVELPRFDAWQARYSADGLQVLAISMDDNRDQARAMADRLHLHFPMLAGNSRLGAAYGGIFGLPVTYLIDRDGIVRKRVEGETNLDQLEVEVQKLLHEPHR